MASASAAFAPCVGEFPSLILSLSLSLLPSLFLSLLPPSVVVSLSGGRGSVALITASGGKKPGKIAARERINVVLGEYSPGTGEAWLAGWLTKGRGRKSSC